MRLRPMSTLLALVLASTTVMASTPTGQAGKPKVDYKKLQGAIRHRCVLECVWLEKSGLVSSNQSEDVTKACVANCMDPKSMKTALELKLSKTWGTSKKESIEVCLPPGEQRFLDDLRCKDGKAPSFKRIGSVGERNPSPKNTGFNENMMNPAYRLKKGELDTHVIDLYKVSCSDKDYKLYFDMYHCGTPKPWAAPAGFSRPAYGM